MYPLAGLFDKNPVHLLSSSITFQAVKLIFLKLWVGESKLNPRYHPARAAITELPWPLANSAQGRR